MSTIHGSVTDIEGIESGVDFGEISVICPYSGILRLLKNLLTSRCVDFGTSTAVVLFAPRRLPARAIHRVLHLGRIGVSIITTPEPNRNGLSLGRAFSVSGETVVIARRLTRKSAILVQELMDLHLSDPDAAICAQSGFQIPFGQIIRVDPAMVLVPSETLRVIGPLDESHIDLQSTIDEICGLTVARGLRVRSRSTKLIHESTTTSTAISRRYPWLDKTHYQESPPPPETPRTGSHHSKSNPTNVQSVLIDFTGLHNIRSGTNHYAGQVLGALSADHRFSMTVLVDKDTPRDLSDLARLFSLPILSNDDPNLLQHRFDFGFIPRQPESVIQVKLLGRLTTSVVVSQFDVIAATTPTYHESVSHWMKHRGSVASALQLVDGIAWLSESARSEAELNGFSVLDKTNLVCGVVLDSIVPATPPRESVVRRPFLLVLGSSYLHKNRLYCLLLLSELQRRGWQGRMLFIGWDPTIGSTRHAEETFLKSHPQVDEAVEYLSQVDGVRLSELMQSASVLIHPSLNEGFGLVPFEAAIHGTPTLLSRRTAFRENIPLNYPGQLVFDPDRDATTCLRLFDSEISSIATGILRERAVSYTREVFADRISRLFSEVAKCRPYN